MDREIVYPGAIPLDTDILSIERNVMIAIGYLAQATLGANLVADGLACTPTVPASMAISIGPGCLCQLGVVDSEPFGSLPAEPVVPLVQMGINALATPFTLTAPAGAGQAVNYLIQASFLQSDATPVVLPYYNAANPGLPYSGPGNSGAPQNTQRLQSVQLEMKAGAPAAAGSQTTPNVDAGWAGLYVVTVPAGAAAISANNISVMPGAPFIAWKLPKLSPGTSRMAEFTPASQGVWNVPQAVTNVKVRVWGAAAPAVGVLAPPAAVVLAVATLKVTARSRPARPLRYRSVMAEWVLAQTARVPALGQRLRLAAAKLAAMVGLMLVGQAVVLEGPGAAGVFLSRVRLGRALLQRARFG